MLSLAELVAIQQAGGQDESAGGLVPNPRVRTCSFCYEFDPRNARHEFRDDWTCTNCGKCSQHHIDFFNCTDCGERCSDHYLRNRRKSALNKFGVPCRCGLDADQIAELAQAEVNAQRRVAEEKRRQARLAQLQDDADQCWAASGYECSVPQAHQLPMCKQCKRFRPASRRKDTE